MLQSSLSRISDAIDALKPYGFSLNTGYTAGVIAPYIFIKTLELTSYSGIATAPTAMAIAFLTPTLFLKQDSFKTYQYGAALGFFTGVLNEIAHFQTQELIH